jgi:putative ABC transport system ATP-binding protein
MERAEVVSREGAKGSGTVPALEARRLVKLYRDGSRRVEVIRGLDLAVPAGEFLVVTGPSGSGKTTLLALLSGLDKPTSGDVFLLGRDITRLTEDELAPVRNRTIGFVFQSYHLVPSLSALENVAFPAELGGDARAVARALALLERAGLTERRDHLPHQLSGGEKQRVAVCRALVNDPAVLFADEPTGNLDSGAGRAVLDLMLSLRQERATTLVMVTHSRTIASLADRVVTMADGRIKG